MAIILHTKNINIFIQDQYYNGIIIRFVIILYIRYIIEMKVFVVCTVLHRALTCMVIMYVCCCFCRLLAGN
jgi:hypothetical protein